MKKILLATACAAALLATACSDATLTKWENSLNNFTAGVAAVNKTIATASPLLGQNCSALESVGFALAGVGGGKTNAALQGVNAAIAGWCQSVGDDKDIADAIATVKGAVADGKAAYKAATGKAI